MLTVAFYTYFPSPKLSYSDHEQEDLDADKPFDQCDVCHLRTGLSEAGTLERAGLWSARFKHGSYSDQKSTRNIASGRWSSLVQADRFLTYRAMKLAKSRAATPKHWVMWASQIATAQRTSSLQTKVENMVALALGSRSAENDPNTSSV